MLYIQYFFEFNKHPVRVSSFFGDELILGSYLSRLLPLLIAFFVMKKIKIYRKTTFYNIFICTYITVILSGERSAFFYINLSFLFILFFIR